MPGHALHSPNIAKAEMRSYPSTRFPARNKYSLVEASEHDPHLVKYLLSPLDPRLVQELIRTTEKAIRIPSDSPITGGPLTPPITPTKNTHTHQSHPSTKGSSLPIHMSSKWKPLDKFIIRLIEASNVRVATLVYTLIVLDRLREKLPPLAQGMRCTRHRIFLAALIVASKYLNDSTPKNRHWNHYAHGLFDTSEITLMEKQMLSLLNFNLRITETELVTRLSPLIYSASASRSKAETTLHPPQFLSPVTPITPTSKKAPVPAQERCNKNSKEKETFALQPVPTVKKCGDKGASEAKIGQRSTSLSDTRPAPRELFNKQDCADFSKEGAISPFLALPALPNIKISKQPEADQVLVAMPLVRSFSSDGLLEGISSTTMGPAPIFSSNVSSSMTSSSSISTRTSANQSEIVTSRDHFSLYTEEAGHSHHYFQTRALGDESKASQLQLSDSVTGAATLPVVMTKSEGDSSVVNRLPGAGKDLSPSPHVGHGVKADRKVFTAIITPEEVHPKH